MSEPIWLEVLDALYEMGGQGKYPSIKAEKSLDSDLDLVAKTGLSRGEVRRGARRLRQMGFAVESERVSSEGPPTLKLSLLDEGHTFAHKRQQEKRNLRSNRTVMLLTIVLAFVGMAQATALTATVSPAISGEFSLWVTVLAGMVLVAIFVMIPLNRLGGSGRILP